MNNRLYCTFVEADEVKEVSEKIQSSYKILFDKIFVLESLDGEKVMLTYMLIWVIQMVNLQLVTQS